MSESRLRELERRVAEMEERLDVSARSILFDNIPQMNQAYHKLEKWLRKEKKLSDAELRKAVAVIWNRVGELSDGLASAEVRRATP